MIALVLWLSLVAVPGHEPQVFAAPSEVHCSAAVKSLRERGIAASDCVKVELPAPKTEPF